MRVYFRNTFQLGIYKTLHLKSAVRYINLNENLTMQDSLKTLF